MTYVLYMYTIRAILRVFVLIYGFPSLLYAHFRETMRSLPVFIVFLLVVLFTVIGYPVQYFSLSPGALTDFKEKTNLEQRNLGTTFSLVMEEDESHVRRNLQIDDQEIDDEYGENLVDELGELEKEMKRKDMKKDTGIETSNFRQRNLLESFSHNPRSDNSRWDSSRNSENSLASKNSLSSKKTHGMVVQTKGVGAPLSNDFTIRSDFNHIIRKLTSKETLLLNSEESLLKNQTSEKEIPSEEFLREEEAGRRSWFLEYIDTVVEPSTPDEAYAVGQPFQILLILVLILYTQVQTYEMEFEEELDDSDREMEDGEKEGENWMEDHNMDDLITKSTRSTGSVSSIRRRNSTASLSLPQALRESNSLMVVIIYSSLLGFYFVISITKAACSSRELGERD